MVRLENLNYGKIKEVVSRQERKYLMAVIQDEYGTIVNGVLMDEEAVNLSIRTNRVCASMRSWGGMQNRGTFSVTMSDLKMIEVDCDKDTLLITLKNPIIGTCSNHAGSYSCFHNSIDDVRFDLPEELAMCIVQSAIDGQVLMVGMMNQEALEKTISRKMVTFWSRKHKRLWTKGETSGNYLELTDARVNCWGTAILCKAIPKGPVCHFGTKSCFDAKDGTRRHLWL